MHHTKTAFLLTIVSVARRYKGMLVEEIGGVKFAIQRDFANFVTKTILGQNWLKAGYQDEQLLFNEKLRSF